MANTYTLISSNTVGAGGAGSVTFSSIPSTYTDLNLVCSVRGSDFANYGIYVTFGTSSAIYSARALQGNGAAASSNNSSLITALWFQNTLAGTGTTSNTFGNGSIYIPNYTSSNNKSTSGDFVTENNATTAFAVAHAGLANLTSAITSIELVPQVGNFVQYSSFYLYGIKNS